MNGIMKRRRGGGGLHTIFGLFFIQPNITQAGPCIGLGIGGTVYFLHSTLELSLWKKRKIKKKQVSLAWVEKTMPKLFYIKKTKRIGNPFNATKGGWGD